MPRFYAEHDKHSAYPGWYFGDTHADELHREISRKEYLLENDLLPASQKLEMRESLKKEKERFDRIVESKPNLSGVDKDALARGREEIGREIKERMFTRDEMMTGRADAHKEARNLSEPCVKVEGIMADMAKEAGMHIEGGMLNRADGERVWKIASKLLDAETDTESLRAETRMPVRAKRTVEEGSSPVVHHKKKGRKSQKTASAALMTTEE
jgi:hypothetical protein